MVEAIYRAESGFADHAQVLLNIAFSESRMHLKPQNYSLKEIKWTDIYYVVNSLLEISISCKAKQESFDIPNGSHFALTGR